MLNWLNRQKSPVAAATAGYPQPTLANWRNRDQAPSDQGRILKPEQAIPRKRRLRSLELLAIAVVIAMIVGIDLYIFGINKRLSALEREFVDVKSWAFPASLLEGKYASLNARLRALTEAYSGLNEKLQAVSSQPLPLSVAAGVAGTTSSETTPEAVGAADPTEGAALEDATLTAMEAELPADAPAAGVEGPAAGSALAAAKTSGTVRRVDDEAPHPTTPSTEPMRVNEPSRPEDHAMQAPRPMEDQPAPTADTPPAVTGEMLAATAAEPAPTSPKVGSWVINLLSDPNQALAARFADDARSRGIPVEENQTQVKGRTYWRVQITGFETAAEARSEAQEVKEKLQLKDVWVFRERR